MKVHLLSRAMTVVWEGTGGVLNTVVDGVGTFD